MSRFGLLGVYVMVGIISLVDRVIGPSLTEDSTKANIHMSKDKGNEKFQIMDTTPNLDDSTNSGRQRKTQSSISDTSFQTPLSDGGAARLHHSTDYPVLYDTTYDSMRQDTTVDPMSHSTTYDPTRHDTTDDSMLHDTKDDSRLHNTTGDMKAVDTVPDFPNHTLSQQTDSANLVDTRRHNTTADTSLHNTTDDIRLHNTTADTSLHNTTYDTSLHNTTADTKRRNTTVDTSLHNRTVGMKALGAVPAFPNPTLSQRNDSANISPLARNVSFINESQMENQGHPEQLLFDTERISNTSKFWNRTYYNDKDRNDTCSMITSVTFILTLGRKMPLYFDIISLVLGTIGIIGNMATITVVAFNFKLRKPYFLTILTLAVADLLNIIVMIGTIFLEFEIAMYIQCLKPELYVFIGSCLSIQMNSSFQVVLIAVIKFLLLVYPIKSKTCVTNNLIVAMFFIILSFATCLSFFACYLIMQKVKTKENINGISFGIFILTILSSCLVIILLHFIKISKLRTSQALQKETKKMNKVVSIILSIYIVYNCLRFSNPVILMFIHNIELLNILNKCLNIAAFIHHGCNPLLYFAFTPLVQKPWQRLKEKFGKR